MGHCLSADPARRVSLVRKDRPTSHALDQDGAQRRGLDRPSHHSAAGGSGTQLVEQRVPGAAAVRTESHA